MKIRNGTWWLNSISDSRWHYEKRGMVGEFTQPPELLLKLEELKNKLGNPPEDLTWGYEKD